MPRRTATAFAFIVSVQVKPSGKVGADQARKHVRGQVQMGSAVLHGCHIKRVTVTPVKES